MFIISKRFIGETLVGKTFGLLTVLEFTQNEKNGAHWLCECSCEDKTQKVIRGDGLKSGKVRSCGCLQKKIVIENNKKYKPADLLGKTFGRLKVIEKTDERHNQEVVWKCQCSCKDRTIKYITSKILISGNTKSCGCLQKEKVAAIKTKDLLGQQFGLLTIIEKTDKRKNGRIVWKCKCSCKEANVIETSSICLLGDGTKSCGCINYSIGETNIAKILTDNNIVFIQQYFFNDLLSTSGLPLKFDFAIIDNNNNLLYLIEFDGEQHERNAFNIDEEKYQRYQNHDKWRNEYCLRNNIPLIRLPYALRDKITLNLLKLENNTYIVK